MNKKKTLIFQSDYRFEEFDYCFTATYPSCNEWFICKRSKEIEEMKSFEYESGYCYSWNTNSSEDFHYYE